MKTWQCLTLFAGLFTAVTQGQKTPCPLLRSAPLSNDSSSEEMAAGSSPSHPTSTAIVTDAAFTKEDEGESEGSAMETGAVAAVVVGSVVGAAAIGIVTYKLYANAHNRFLTSDDDLLTPQSS